MKKIVLVIVAMLWALSAFAYRFTFEGYAAGKYAIVMEVDRNANGSITGRYAYKSTLNDRGRNNRAAWLYIAPDGNSKTDYIITDSDGKVQEHWSNASFSRSNGVNYFTVSVRNARGRTFTINLHSTTEFSSSSSSSSHIQTSPNTPSAASRADENTAITAYYADHIWACAPSKAAFYAWMRKDSQELWRSETGQLSSDLMQLVETYNGM